MFPSGKPHLTHGQFRNTNMALKHFHRHCERLKIRARRIHDSRRTFISLARDDGAQRDVIKSLTHPLDSRDAHDSYTTFAWSRSCEEVSKLKIALRRPGEVIALPKAAHAGAKGDLPEVFVSEEPAETAPSRPTLTFISGGDRAELHELRTDDQNL